MTAPPLLPPALGPGDTIAVVSPSWGGAGLLRDRRDRAVSALRRLGYEVRLMPHAAGVTDGTRDWVSGSRAERLADLHDAFADPAVGGVLAAIGGQHSAQLLDGLDLDLVRTHPKVFCGYSDITSLHHALHARTGLVTFYGPALLPEFGEVGGPDEEVVAHFRRVVGRPDVSGPLPRVPWQADEPRQVTDPEGRARARHAGEPRTVLRAGEGSGPLLAGCLPSVRGLVGTPWQPSYAGRVLVLEAPEAPYSPEDADTDLTHLRNAGLLEGLAGLVVGRTDGWPERDRDLLHACVLDAVRGYDYPVLAGVECTHSAPQLTLPLGVPARIVGEDLVLEGPAVR